MESTLVKENSRLTQLVRRMQDAVSTLREEVSDANAELAASRRLFDEQKQILLQELDRERLRRSQLESQVESLSMRYQRKQVSVGTNTIPTSDAAVETVDSHHRAPQGAITTTERNSSISQWRTPLEDFSDWLVRSVGCREDLHSIFLSMGARTVEEVCANITEGDLVSSGVALLKARAIMHLIMEQTMSLLSGRR